MNQVQVSVGKTKEELELQAINEDLPTLIRDVAEIGRHLAVAYIGIDRNDSGSIRPKVVKALEDFSKIMENVTGEPQYIPTSLEEMVTPSIALLYTPEDITAGRERLCRNAREIMMDLLMIYNGPSDKQMGVLVSSAPVILERFNKISALLQALQASADKKKELELEEARRQRGRREFELKKRS